jgi:hypothetical protein
MNTPAWIWQLSQVVGDGGIGITEESRKAHQFD